MRNRPKNLEGCSSAASSAAIVWISEMDARNRVSPRHPFLAGARGAGGA